MEYHHHVFYKKRYLFHIYNPTYLQKIFHYLQLKFYRYKLILVMMGNSQEERATKDILKLKKVLEFINPIPIKKSELETEYKAIFPAGVEDSKIINYNSIKKVLFMY